MGGEKWRRRVLRKDVADDSFELQLQQARGFVLLVLVRDLSEKVIPYLY